MKIPDVLYVSCQTDTHQAIYRAGGHTDNQE